MKKILLTLAIALGLAQITKAQGIITCVPCDQLGMSINVGSSETSISIYHWSIYDSPTIRKYIYVGVYRPTRKHITSRHYN